MARTSGIKQETAQAQSSYVVLEETQFFDAEGNEQTAWVELGTYPGENGRKAVERVLIERGAEEGNFRTIPSRSAEVHRPRSKRTLTWE
jgi:hypothetical protein